MKTKKNKKKMKRKKESAGGFLTLYLFFVSSI